MKRVFLAILIAGVLFGAVYASAARVDFNAGTLQAGIDTDLQCQESPLHVADYTYDHEGDLGDGSNDLALNTIVLGVFDEECYDARVRLTLYDEDGKFLDSAVGWVTPPYETVVFDLGRGDDGPPIWQIYKIGVVLEQPGYPE
jgi:hypothetical protein